MNISLNGKAALVTGAGRGIGFAISKLLSASGANVLLVDIDESALADAKKQLSGTGAKVSTHAADLSKSQAPDGIIRQMLTDFGAIDIIVNNAGYTWDNVIQKTSDEQFQAMLDIHVSAPFRILRAASGWMRETAKKEIEAGNTVMRKVVNITSISGLDGNAGQVAYASAKSAVVGFTKTMAKEWGRYNVNVNAVGFGLIDTRLTRAMTEPETAIEIGERQVQVGMQAQTREQVAKLIPLGRIGTPDDAANSVFFFCSPLSDYLTGQVLVSSGGLRF